MLTDLEYLIQRVENTPGWEKFKLESFYSETGTRSRPRHGPLKYFGAGGEIGWVSVALDRWKTLERLDPKFIALKTSVLDIGTGFGYFPMCGRYLYKSKRIDATDTPDPLYDTVTDMLGIQKYELSVNAFTPLDIPKGLRRYDLITSHRIVFDSNWGEAEWRFFLADVCSSLLNKGGTLLLGFNDRREYRFRRWSGVTPIGDHSVLLPYEIVKKLGEGGTC